jgi:hypothetical protein
MSDRHKRHAFILSIDPYLLIAFVFCYSFISNLKSWVHININGDSFFRKFDWPKHERVKVETTALVLHWIE